MQIAEWREGWGLDGADGMGVWGHGWVEVVVMLLSELRPEGERHLRGEGPRRIRVPGGKGRWPSFAGDGYSFSVAVPLCSVGRFRVMHALCLRRWVRAPALAEALGMHVNSVGGALHGMRDMGMAACRAAAIGWPYSRSRTGGVYAVEWCATEVGRLMLWRFARVSGELLPFVWGDVERWLECGDGVWDEGTISGYLARDLEPLLMRPVGLALANRIMFDRNQTEMELARSMGVWRSAVVHRLRVWREKGWIAGRRRFDAAARFRPRVRRADVWRMTPAGWQAVHDHVWGLCWAAQSVAG